MSRQVLILGAGGYLGQRLTSALTGSEWKPVAALRRKPPSTSSSSSDAIALDATDPEQVAAAMANCHAVVNCVSGNAGTILANATALATAADTQTRPPRIVHLSSQAVYGAQNGVLDESAELLGDLGHYSAAKAQAEHSLSTYSNTVILRPGCIYGPGSPQWTDRIARWLIAGRLGDLGTAGDGYCNLVYVEDVIQAIKQALVQPLIEGQAYNLAQPGNWRWNDYFIRYALALHAVPVARLAPAQLWRESWLWAAPLKLASNGLRLLRSNTSLPDPMPPSLLRLWRQELRLDTHKATRLLGLRWTQMDDGIQKLAANRLNGASQL